MTDRRYEEPPFAGVQEVLVALRLGDPEVSSLLVGAALNDADWAGVQNLCLDLLAGPDRRLAAVAATCLGHLGRIHRTLHLELVVPALVLALRDPRTAGAADSALDDLEIFLGVIRPVIPRTNGTDPKMSVPGGRVTRVRPPEVPGRAAGGGDHETAGRRAG